MPILFASTAMGKMPGTGLTRPSKDNSPTQRLVARKVVRRNPCAVSKPTAIGKSNSDPSLGISAGARLITGFVWGISKEVLTIAVRTRSFDSSTDLFGSPTILKLGKQ